jgi:hypothetical protein
MAMMLAPLSLNDTDLPTVTGGAGPWSGGVAQAINPWRFITTLMGNQFSLFTVNLGRSSAPDTEAAILENVGSYGRQIGRIGEALGVLINELPRDRLRSEARAAIEDFSSQMREIKRIKDRRAV